MTPEQIAEGRALLAEFIKTGWGGANAWNYWLRQNLLALLDAAERVARLEAEMAALTDANAVHANMLRGSIAKPSVEQIVHLYGADVLVAALPQADRLRAIEAENARLREALKAKPWPPTDDELREMLAQFVGAWWSQSSAHMIRNQRLRIEDIKAMYAVRDALAPFVARAALNGEGGGA